MTCHHKNFNFKKFSAILFVGLLVVNPISAQQRGFTGDVKIQLPIRSPIYQRYDPSQGTVKDVRSLIQFDRNLDQELPAPTPSLQNDPPSSASSSEINLEPAAESINRRIKEKSKILLSNRRQDLEKLITSKFSQLEKQLVANEATLLEKVNRLNQTLTELIRTFNQTAETELVERVDEPNPPPRKDNALLHLYSLVNSFDFSKSSTWSIHNWIEKGFQYSAFSKEWDEMNQLQDRNDEVGANETTTLTLITSSECGGPAITEKEGTFSFTPSSNFPFSKGVCIWRLAPAGARSIIVKLSEDSFLRSHSSANLTLIPQNIKNWSPILNGVKYAKSSIKESCESEWNCHGFDDGPSSTKKVTERVINILKNGEHSKILSHRDRSKNTFTERTVYLILNFNVENGPPPSFKVQFKGRDCWFCSDKEGKVFGQLGGKKDKNDTFGKNMLVSGVVLTAVGYVIEIVSTLVTVFYV